jgi:hypothetical protein
VYEFTGTQWVDRGLPPGTKAVGTPAAAASGALPRVLVRGANGNVEELLETARGTWKWVDLANPGAATNFSPAVITSGGYTGVLVATPSGHLALRESLGRRWAPWRDLGAFPSPAVTGPSAIFNGSSITAYVTGANQQVEQASFPPGGPASLGTIPAFDFQTLPPVSSAPSATTLANGDPTIFASDAAGNLMQFVWTRFPQPDRPGGFTSTNYGSLLGTAMGAPTALASFGSATAFSVSSNQHVGETHVSGMRHGVFDHTALSRVIYQAHDGQAPSSNWGELVNEGQSATNGYLKYPDAFRVQSTIAGSVLCQAYIPSGGVGWLPEVNDGQVCGTFSGRSVGAIRLRLADAATGMHLLYRCHLAQGLALTWTPWVADGTACGAPGLDQPVTAIQVQFSDAPL